MSASSQQIPQHELTGPLTVELDATTDEVDSESFDDFYASFNEIQQQCELVVVDLEAHPNHTEYMYSLYGFLHQLKSDLVLAGFHSLLHLAQRIEDLVYLIKMVRISYSTSISDLILLSIDLLKLLLSQRINQKNYSYSQDNYQKICDALYQLNVAHGDDREDRIFEAILKLDPNTSLKSQPKETVGDAVVLHPHSSLMSILDEFGVHFNEDLKFFQGLMYAFEKRSHYWEGRHERLLHIALTMNTYAHNPVTPNQLTAAVFMHDIGMR